MRNRCGVLLLGLVFVLQKLSSATCPKGSVQGLHENDCYLYITTPDSWFKAEDLCVILGGHLASIHDAFTNAFLPNQACTTACSSASPSVWLGGYWNDTASAWQWSDGSGFDYADWSAGEPSLHSGACISMSVWSSDWSSVNCHANVPFICKFPSVSSESCPTPTPVKCTEAPPCPTQQACPESPPCPTQAVVTCPTCPEAPTCSTQAPLSCSDPPPCPSQTAPPCPDCPEPPPCPLCTTPHPLTPACPSGWTYYASTDKCYQAVCNVAAQDSSASCQNLGGTLASVHNLDDNNWLNQFGLNSCPADIGFWNGAIWLGVFDVQLAQNWTGYNWQWADGTAMDFTNWSQNQPDGEGTQRCVSINGRADAVGQWDDSDCSVQMRAAVCQMEPTYS